MTHDRVFLYSIAMTRFAFLAIFWRMLNLFLYSQDLGSGEARTNTLESFALQFGKVLFLVLNNTNTLHFACSVWSINAGIIKLYSTKQVLCRHKKHRDTFLAQLLVQPPNFDSCALEIHTTL